MYHDFLTFISKEMNVRATHSLVDFCRGRWLSKAVKILILTFVLSCWLVFVVCCGLSIAVVAAIAFGYHYSMAEYLSLKDPNVIWRKKINARRSGSEIIDTVNEMITGKTPLEWKDPDILIPERRNEFNNYKDWLKNPHYSTYTEMEISNSHQSRQTTWITDDKTPDPDIFLSNLKMRNFEPNVEDKPTIIRKFKPISQAISDSKIRKLNPISNTLKGHMKKYEPVETRMLLKGFKEGDMREEAPELKYRWYENNRKFEPIGEGMMENIPKATEEYDYGNYKIYNPANYKFVTMQKTSMYPEKRKQMKIESHEETTEDEEDDPYRPV